MEAYTAPGKDAFLSDRLRQDAVIRNLEVMADAARNLPAELKDAHPEVNWKGIAAFRNVLAHDYMKLDLPRTWQAIEDDLPGLKAAVAAMRKQLGI